MNKLKKMLCGSTIVALLIINFFLIVIIFIGFIIEANTMPKYSDKILYTSETYEYKNHHISVKVRNITDLDNANDIIRIGIEFYCDGRQISLFAQSFQSDAKDEYSVTFDEELFSIHINNNYDFDIVYKFDYDDIIKNF